MVKLKMSENLKEATTFIEQGHIRVGPHTITDPSFLGKKLLITFIIIYLNITSLMFNHMY